MATTMDGKRILITGSAGSVGSELYRQLAPTNTVLGLDFNETALFDLHEEYRLKGHDVHYRLGDVRDRKIVSDTIRDFKPDIIFHCAALKHVTPNEEFPLEAIETNIIGTVNVVQEAKAWHVPKLVYISTDKAINSYSVMGVTKKLGELITKNAGYVAVRFGNVLGSRGSVIPIWQRQLDQGEPLTITDERMQRYFMSIEEAANLVISAAEYTEPCILIMDMGEKKNILEAAKKILLEMGKADYPVKVIGMRPGETLTEDIMTPEEQKRARKEGRFWVIT